MENDSSSSQEESCSLYNDMKLDDISVKEVKQAFKTMKSQFAQGVVMNDYTMYTA